MRSFHSYTYFMYQPFKKAPKSTISFLAFSFPSHHHTGVWLVYSHNSTNNTDNRHASAQQTNMEWVEEVVREWNEEQKAQADWFVVRHLPLHIALFSSAPAGVVSALLSALPKATMKKDRYGRRPLHFAAQYQAPADVVSALLFIYPEAAQKKDKFGNLPLHLATRNGKIYDIPPRMPPINSYSSIAAGTIPDSVRELGSNLPLHVGLTNKASAEVVSALLSIYPEAAEEKDSECNVPLHLALTNKASAEVVFALLSIYPEAVEEKNSEGNLPLYLAFENQAPAEVVFALLRIFPQAAREKNKGDNLPLYVALENQAPAEVVSALLSIYPQAARETGGFGLLPLRLAAYNRENNKESGNLPVHVGLKNKTSAEVVSALLCIYPEAAEKENSEGSLPLHVALENQASAAVVSALLAIYPEAARKKGGGGLLPFHLAACNQASAEVISMLPEQTSPKR